MTFPNYKRILFWKIKDGWEDRGPVENQYKIDTQIFTVCGLCRTRANVGREGDETFLFCKKCLDKLTPKNETPKKN